MSLKEELLKLLEEDREFRYAVAGLIGLREVLERLDRLWEEVKSLREDQERTWREIQKIWGEVKALREDQRRLWEGQERIWREIQKLWGEVRGLREDQRRLWEGQQRLWEEVRELRRGQERLWREVEGLRVNFRQLGRAVGMTLEFYAAAFLEKLLAERGHPGAEVRVGVKLMHRGRLIELDLLCEEPLLVGEVTTYLGSAEEAEGEVAKLLERVRAVEEAYGRRVELAVLAVANLSRDAAKALESLSAAHGIMVVTDRELEQASR